MPSYLYKCPACGNQEYWTHGMMIEAQISCSQCGEEWMQKKPQRAAVNWNGPPPSAGGKHPLVQELNATLPQRRDEFARKKEAHVKRTESENG